jgi:hypothetical protein
MRAQPSDFALVAALCLATVQGAAGAGANGSPAEVARFIEENVGLTTEPLTLDQLRKRIAATGESSRAVANAHVQGQIDHIVTLRARDLEVEAYVPDVPGPLLVLRIKLTDASRKLPHDLQIGRSSLDEIYEAFGDRAENARGPAGEFAKRYSTLEGNANAMLWFDGKERLAGVEWRFASD